MIVLFRRDLWRPYVLWARFIQLVSRRFQVEAFEVAVYEREQGDEGSSLALEKVRSALELLRRHDPGRLARIRQDIRSILICGSPRFRGEYIQALGICHLTREWLARQCTSAAEAAMVIAHEATHARLRNEGYRGRSRQVRVERLCLQAEISLARRLPNATQALRVARRMHADAERIWSPEAHRVRADRARAIAIEEMRKSGTPRWILRWIERRGRRSRA